ncbi:hypothetical protein CVT26_006763 [Gymnopilus dilepis]|uniref:Phosphoglucomutase n=1 Tax=Gymnopilus dilepis TaxID=231916 RepID=A0A409W6M4_9AGAR|nr:hypothetical protein CVT26_006763 [Gymnopilus dilepis]
MTVPSLKELVEEWLLLDSNPETRQEIQLLWQRQDLLELEKRLRTRIEFGTAGLRGRMEAGWSRMNDLIIAQTSEGLSDYILQHVKDARNRGLVIGYDHRHHSENWANLTANIFMSKGIRVYLLRGFSHTPLRVFYLPSYPVASSNLRLQSAQDNGYKVYWENSVQVDFSRVIVNTKSADQIQIISPHDKGISSAIQANSKKGLKIPDNFSIDLQVDLTQKLREEYFNYLKDLLKIRSSRLPNSPKFVNTSMHGVGDAFVHEAFALLGFPPYTPVKEQQRPDPEFPTVAFPNPEEKGALALAIEIATRKGANYVLAQDPDADRFTAVERRSTGEWTLFTGDQLGVIFASNILEAFKLSGKPLNTLAMVASTVSSRMLESMAKVEGFRFVECLTGFKYIGNTALRLEEEGFVVPFGYEEAIGFMFGQQIRDKDGVAATVHFVELATYLHAKGQTVNDYLQNLYQRLVYTQVSDPPNGVSKQSEGTESTYPKTLAGLQVYRIIDLTKGYDSANPPTYAPQLPLSPGQMIQFRAGDKSQGINIFLTLRTSGTEPKIKFYLEGNGNDADFVDKLLADAVSDLSGNWVQIDKHNLAIA